MLAVEDSSPLDPVPLDEVVVDVVTLLPEAPLLPPTRLVAAARALEAPAGEPLTPPPALAVLVTEPVALSDEVVELDDTVDVDLTVTVESARIKSPLLDRPRLLRLPARRGGMMVAYRSACVTPATRSALLMGRASTVTLGMSPVAAAGPSGFTSR